jgi:glycyl-tRNA synthetase
MQDIYDKIMTLAKRRGFIYPSFEIYGGAAGFYDYGPLGSRLKNNIENMWRNYFLFKDSCVEIDTPTVTLYPVLKASGHVEEFTDLTIDCSKCRRSYKVEDIVEDVEQALKEGKIECPSCGETLENPYQVNLMFSTTIGKERKAFLRPETAQGIFTNFHFLYRYNREKLPLGVIQIGRGYRNEISPRQGIIRLREFSMAEAEIFFDPQNKTHPRFKDVEDKELYLFDNEREFRATLKETVERKIINSEALAYYMYLTQDFLLSIGIDPKKFRFRKHSAKELAHYAQECWDAELYSSRFGWVECVGIADRSAYDLNAHISSSGIDMYAKRILEKPKQIVKKKIVPKMSVLGPMFKERASKIREALEKMEEVKEEIIIDGETIPRDCYEIVEKKEKISSEKFIPHVIEPSFGIDRILYFVLEHNFCELEKKGEVYRILRLNPRIAPIKVGVFPLVGHEELIEVALKVNEELAGKGIATYYDESGTIGRRYARMDEVGTPFCITIDHETLENSTVTIRDRDTSHQIRKKIEDVYGYLQPLV